MFSLRMKELEALEAECWNYSTGKPGVALGVLWKRVMSGDWAITDITNIVMHGLIGGGMGIIEARQLVRTYVEGRPISTLTPGVSPGDCPLTVAQAVLAAAVVGVDAEDQGESQTPRS